MAADVNQRGIIGLKKEYLETKSKQKAPFLNLNRRQSNASKILVNRAKSSMRGGFVSKRQSTRS
jgi:hypothetical protein